MNDLQSILNKEQIKAVTCTEGPLLVLSGAGSGKTRVLTYRTSYLIDELNVPPYEILAITFTNKAAAEMKERIQSLIGDRAREAWISTFHSMCVRILRKNIELLGYTHDFTIYDTDDQKSVIRALFKEMNIDSKMYKERAVLSSISSAKNQGLSPDDMLKSSLSPRDKTIAELYRMYEKRLKDDNSLDFDDLLLKTSELFRARPEVLKKYQVRFRYIMVDEYQDTNNIQFQLVKDLAGFYKNICVVGDDDQSIYRFRGADLTNILSFEEYFPGARVIKLEQNYRSTKNILDIANSVIKNNKGRKEKSLWTDKKGGKKPVFLEFESAPEEARRIILEAGNGDFSLRDQAVLYRTNAQSRLLEEQCIKQNIPYHIVGGQNFYQRKEIKDILSYLRLLVNPNDRVSFLRIINIPKRGIGQQTVEKLENLSEKENISLLEATRIISQSSKGKSSASLLSFYDYIQKLTDLSKADSSDIKSLIESIMDDTGYRTGLLSEGTEEASSRLQNIEELISKAVSYEENDAPSLSGFLEEVSLVADTDNKSSDNDFLTLMTLHGAKGLEFKRIFLSGFSDGLFPSIQSLSEPEELEEERRLLYVGITRAMQELVITSARSRMINGSYEYLPPSSFLDEIPDDLIEKHLLSKRSYSDWDETSGDFGGSERFGRSDMFGRSDTFGSFRERQSERFESFNDFERSQRFGSFDRFGSFRDQIPINDSKKAYASKSHDKSCVSPFKIPVSTGIKKTLPEYREGDRVKHIKFGEGTVLEIEEGKRDYEVTVKFDDNETRRLLHGFAKLVKI